ncbi:TetR/AcrR family transcriptional regulator [Fusobacterium sp. PH5-44]|uniref:TetR/AcrR family transcriptional regulator n=1 Tax=unclassified Fusobacterium TaxID=2648384 RepID=UPI003D1A66B0
MVIKKEGKIRKNEVLDIAESLFYTKGYSKTTINDILNEAGIAKGTLYYYFKSKEEIMDAIIMRIIKIDVMNSKKIADDTNLTPVEKIYSIIINQKPENVENKGKIFEQLCKPENYELQQKSLALSVKFLSPLIASVVEDGIKQKIFSTPYPLEMTELLLISGNMMFDEIIFELDAKSLERRINAFILSMEKLLGAKKGTFRDAAKMLLWNRK